MKKIFFGLILLFMFALTGCDKENTVMVTYFVTNSQQGFSASYLDDNGELLSSYIPTASKNDKITIHSYLGTPGEIVYISVKDTTTTSFVKVYIYLDRKVYKQASRTDDKTMPVTVSGTIPY